MKALQFFRMAVATPATVSSAIALEAYKKYVLVSLIVHGEVCLSLLWGTSASKLMWGTQASSASQADCNRHGAGD